MRFLLLVLIGFSFAACQHKPERGKWRLMLHEQGQPEREVIGLPEDLSEEFSFNGSVNGIDMTLRIVPGKGYSSFHAIAIPQKDERKFYLSLQRSFTTETPFNFNGEVRTPEVFRQSPHDVNAWVVTTIAEQAVPVVALRSEKGFDVAISDSPFRYDNYTSQAFDLAQKKVVLSSGDNGSTPGLKPDTTKQLTPDYNAERTQVFSPGRVVEYYHPTSPEAPHHFEGIVFHSDAKTIKGLRRDVNKYVAHHFSNGMYTDYFGALSFTTAYMNLRRNESGRSRLWVVPSVEYGNRQYGRDAFWISMMLNPDYSGECFKNELDALDEFAEYPLFALLWAYRSWLAGVDLDEQQLQRYVDAVEKRVRDNNYYSFLESDGRLDFQYWGDLMAFEKDDVVTYNQGLLAVALRAAVKMNLKVKSSFRKATENYRKLYNVELGIYPASLKKNDILGPDPLVGDLLSMIYFGEPLVSDSTVKRHFELLTNVAKTPYGFKINSTSAGEYLSLERYDVDMYVSQMNREDIPEGRYFRGGSYFLYDNLFLIGAYLHGIKGAEDLLRWRTAIDFRIGNTTFETINTKTGEPWKPNMGWNVAIYAIWRKLVDEKKASDQLFRDIDAIANSEN